MDKEFPGVNNYCTGVVPSVKKTISRAVTPPQPVHPQRYRMEMLDTSRLHSKFQYLRATVGTGTPYLPGQFYAVFGTAHLQKKNIYIYIYTQGVPGGMCQTLGECSLC